MATDELSQRTEDACGQLTRYGGSIWSHELADILDKIVDLNDNLWHGRHIEIIKSDVGDAKILLDKLFAIEVDLHQRSLR